MCRILSFIWFYKNWFLKKLKIFRFNQTSWSFVWIFINIFLCLFFLLKLRFDCGLTHAPIIRSFCCVYSDASSFGAFLLIYLSSFFSSMQSHTHTHTHSLSLSATPYNTRLSFSLRNTLSSLVQYSYGRWNWKKHFHWNETGRSYSRRRQGRRKRRRKWVWAGPMKTNV